MIDIILSLAAAFGFTLAINVGVFGLLAYLLTRRGGEGSDWLYLFVLILGMSMVGTCAGFTGGLSREPAVGAIIPALFGLFGGVALYLFGLDRSRGAVASLMAGCLSVSLFLSYVVSAQFRNYNDELRDLRGHCIAAYTNGDIIGDADALAAFERRFLPYCQSALDWNMDQYHRDKVIRALPGS